MEEFEVTLVGQDIFREVDRTCKLIGLTKINRISRGMLGNLRTLTYSFGLEEEKVISTRKALMEALQAYGPWLMPMYEHGKWMHVYVFKASSFT